MSRQTTGSASWPEMLRLHCLHAAFACTTGVWLCSACTIPSRSAHKCRVSTGPTAVRLLRPAATQRCGQCSHCPRSLCGPTRRSNWAGLGMGNRLSAISTRTGDAGTTGLGDGSRVSKSDPRVAAMGDVDELNCAIGMLIAIGVVADELSMQQLLADVQQDLLDLGGELSIPGY